MTLRPGLNIVMHSALPRRPVIWFLLGVVVLALLTLGTWLIRASVGLNGSPSALAAVTSGWGNRVTGYTVEDGSARIPARLRGGAIWPQVAVAPGSRLTVSVKTASVLWNPWATSSTAKMTLAAPTNPPVATRRTHVKLGHAPTIHLGATSVDLSVRPHTSQQWTILDGVADRFRLSLTDARPGESGTVLVRTRARAWEQWSRPILLSWSTPAYLTAHATWSATSRAIVVHFSRPVKSLKASVALHPSFAGSWRPEGPSTWTFTLAAADALYPGETVSVVLPGGAQGVRTSDTFLAHATTLSVSLPLGQVLRAQEILAALGYLPLTWSGSTATDAASELQSAYTPPQGTFSWRYPNTPSTLQALWSPGHITAITTGAVMTFESQHGLAVDGVIGPKVWQALIQADEKSAAATTGYSYVYVSETLPEQLSIWENGQTVLTSLTNTGIAATPTPLGTSPVYLRYTSQTMSGLNPNGTPYRDPGVPWVNYFSGANAVHGFVRAQYGFPQSLGCVELPVAEAAIAWQHIQYGTLVTVAAPGSPHSP